MKFRTASHDSPEISLTPLIDVVFLLLIFFMASTTFEPRSELRVELPEAGARADPREGAVIHVAIDAGGGVRVAGRALADSRTRTLRRALADAARGLDSPPVVISADARTPHQSVVAVMDAARRTGLYELGFATRLPAEPVQ